MSGQWQRTAGPLLEPSGIYALAIDGRSQAVASKLRVAQLPWLRHSQVPESPVCAAPMVSQKYCPRTLLGRAGIQTRTALTNDAEFKKSGKHAASNKARKNHQPFKLNSSKPGVNVDGSMHWAGNSILVGSWFAAVRRLTLRAGCESLRDLRIFSSRTPDPLAHVGPNCTDSSGSRDKPRQPTVRS